MIGFYVASLAAIATFSRECLDKPIDGEKLTLFSKENGILYNRILTRRHFLTYLFGYLSFLSIFIYIFGIFFSTISPIIFIEKYTKIPIEWVSIFFVFTYLYLFFQMIILTLFGLFYLSDRLQWYSEKS